MKKFLGLALAGAAMFGGAGTANATGLLTVTSVGVVYSGAPTADLYIKKSMSLNSYTEVANDVRVVPQKLVGTIDGNAVELFTYCVDIFQYSGPGKFSVVSLQDYLHDDNRFEEIAALISKEGGSLANPLGKIHDATVQLAIWEIINESSANLDVGTGRFKVKDVKGGAIATPANSMAQAAKTGTIDPSLRLFVAKSDKQQDLLFWMHMPSSAVPEPASWAMMILGLGAVGASLRASRRRTGVRFA